MMAVSVTPTPGMSSHESQNNAEATQSHAAVTSDILSRKRRVKLLTDRAREFG
jgi:hypothetical protein